MLKHITLHWRRLCAASLLGAFSLSAAPKDPFKQLDADLDLKSKDGSTALLIASFFAHPEIVEALLEAGADPNIRNNNGSTALDTVQTPWEQIKPIYDIVGGILGPAGLKLDYERIQKTRPKIAVML